MRVLLLSCALALQIEAASQAQVMPKELQEMQQMQAVMIDAQVKAVRRGDEAMNCQAIEKELLTSMNDPALQAYAAKAAATAEKELTALDKPKAPMTPQAAAALAAGLTPDLASLLTGSPTQPLTPAQQLQYQAAYMKQLTAIMPQLMRSQRLVQLAFVKQCGWAFGADVTPLEGLDRAPQRR